MTNGHSLVDAYRLFNRNLEGPVAAKTDIALASGGMDIDAKATRGGFTLQEGYMGMGFGIFQGSTQVKYMRLEHKALVGDLKIINEVMFAGIDHFITVFGQPLAEVNIVGIAAQEGAVIGSDKDGSFCYLLQYAQIG